MGLYILIVAISLSNYFYIKVEDTDLLLPSNPFLNIFLREFHVFINEIHILILVTNNSA